MRSPTRRLVMTALARSLWLAPALLAGSATWAEPPTSPAPAATGPYKRIRWGELVPAGWDPYVTLRDRNLGPMPFDDGTPKAMQRMKVIRDIWDNAPTDASMNGQNIQLAGYIVPLEETRKGMKEFLLVPYFGACIHSPPPPANQIVHVLLNKPVQGFSSMDTVIVSGTLSTERQDSGMGVSGYRLAAVAVERYTPANRASGG